MLDWTGELDRRFQALQHLFGFFEYSNYACVGRQAETGVNLVGWRRRTRSVRSGRGYSRGDVGVRCDGSTGECAAGCS